MSRKSHTGRERLREHRTNQVLNSQDKVLWLIFFISVGYCYVVERSPSLPSGGAGGGLAAARGEEFGSFPGWGCSLDSNTTSGRGNRVRKPHLGQFMVAVRQQFCLWKGHVGG